MIQPKKESFLIKNTTYKRITDIKNQVAIKNGWKSFDEYYQQGNKLDVLAMMDEVVETYARVQLEIMAHKWISIEDEKPKYISLVLIWTNISINPTLGYYVNEWMYFSVNGNIWLRDEPHIKVLYWQYLPGPPQQLLDKLEEENKRKQDGIDNI